MKSNCLIWALWKWKTEGGYLCLRASKHKHWWPIRLHVLWHPAEPNDEFEHYAPKKGDLGKFPPPFFNGEVNKGDKEDS